MISGSLGTMSGIADTNLLREDIWASGEVWSLDVNSHGFLFSFLGSA